MDGHHWKSITFLAFRTTFATATATATATTTTNTRRSTGYWTTNGESGNTNSFNSVRTLELHVQVSRLRFAKGQTFEFGLGSILIHELGSSTDESKNPMTQTNTPKFMEKVAIKIMQVDKADELF